MAKPTPIEIMKMLRTLPAYPVRVHLIPVYVREGRQ